MAGHWRSSGNGVNPSKNFHARYGCALQHALRLASLPK
jgi:hypothetical protein